VLLPPTPLTLPQIIAHFAKFLGTLQEPALSLGAIFDRRRLVGDRIDSSPSQIGGLVACRRLRLVDVLASPVLPLRIEVVLQYVANGLRPAGRLGAHSPSYVPNPTVQVS
jgi:hypothetical protein